MAWGDNNAYYYEASFIFLFVWGEWMFLIPWWIVSIFSLQKLLICIIVKTVIESQPPSMNWSCPSLACIPRKLGGYFWKAGRFFGYFVFWNILLMDIKSDMLKLAAFLAHRRSVSFVSSKESRRTSPLRSMLLRLPGANFSIRSKSRVVFRAKKSRLGVNSQGYENTICTVQLFSRLKSTRCLSLIKVT